MPVSVPLRFVPPDQEDLAILRVYEAGDSDGPWSEIEFTTEVGEYPTYIDNFTTVNASSPNGWFAIRWEDARGALGPLSQGIQGGTDTLVGQITSRVHQRDRTLDLAVVSQEAAAVIEQIFGTTEPDPQIATAMQMSGMTSLTLARCKLQLIPGTTASGFSFTAGLVSLSDKGAGSTQELANILALMEQAMRSLGLSTAVVAQMVTSGICCDFKTPVMADISRLEVDFA